MTGTRAAALLLLLLLLLPAVLGARITSLSLVDGNVTLTTASPSNEQVADLLVTTDTAEGYLYLDLQGLHSDQAVAAQYANLRIELSGCERNETTGVTRCLLEHLRIRPANGSIVIPYRFFHAGSEQRGNATLRLTLDNHSPVVTSITTPVCDAAKRCYLGDNQETTVTVTMDDGPFARKLLFLKAGTQAFRAERCAGSSCAFTVTLPCSDGRDVPLEITEANGLASQDDAGNPVTGNRTEATCDGRPPKLLSASVNGTGLLGIAVESGRLNVYATVQDRSPVTLIANLSQVQRNATGNSSLSAACVVKGDAQECRLSIGSLQAGKNLRLPLIFRDGLGQESSRTLTVKEIYRGAAANETTDFFEAKATAVTPGTINRATLALALGNGLEYPVHVTYGYRQLVTGTTLIGQSIDATKCEVALNATGGDPYDPERGENWSRMASLFRAPVALLDPAAGWEAANRLDARILDSAVADWTSDRVLVRCPLQLVVRKGSLYYPAPEEKWIAFPLTLRESKLGTPGKAFLEKIEKEQEALDSGANKLIRQLSALKQTMAQICQLQDIFSRLETSGGAIEALGWLLSATPSGPPLIKAGLAMTLAGLEPHEKLSAGDENALSQAKDALVAGQEGESCTGGYLRQACCHLHCDTAGKMEENDNWFTDSKTEQGFANTFTFDETGDSSVKNFWNDYAGDLTTPDVGNSLIMSMATGCIGGVIDGLEKYQEIDCGYLLCLKEQAHYGASITPCELGRGMKMCRFILDEAFEMPYARVIKNLMGSVNQVVQAPLVFLAQVIFNPTCKVEKKVMSLKGFGCRILNGLTLQKDFRSVTQFNYQYITGPERTLCDAALCEGDSCYETSSYLGQILPGSWLSGDQYRQAMMLKQRQRDESQKAKSAYSDELKTLTETDNSYNKKEFPTLTSYCNAHLPKDADCAAFFNEVVKNNCADCDRFVNIVDAGVYPKSSTEFEDAKKLPTNMAGSIGSYAQIFSGEKGAALKRSVKQCAEHDDTGLDCLALKKNSAYKQFQEQLKKERVVYCPGSDAICGNCKDDGTCLESREIDKYSKQLPTGFDWNNAFNVLVDSFITIGLQQLQAEGKLQFLYASGLGDWYGSAAADVGEYLDPERLKMNLCNPAGAFSDYTEDNGAVYALQSGVYRPVLTFAGEILPLDGSYLYTVSGVVSSPYKEVELRLTLEPGNRPVKLGGADSLAVAKGNGVSSFAAAVNDTAEFSQLCVRFDEPFPEKANDATVYCRDLAASAYSRGGPGGELEDFGEEDPYRTITGGSSGDSTGIFSSGLFGGGQRGGGQ